RRAPAAAPGRRARSRQADLGARLPRAVGADPRRSGDDRPGLPGRTVRVTMLVRCLAMMRGGGETRHLAWAHELSALGVEVDIITGAPLFGEPRYPVDDVPAVVVR